MAMTAFAAPLLPGTTDAWLAAVEEANGPRSEQRTEAHLELGLTREIAHLQRTPMGDVVVVYLEAEDTDTDLQRTIASEHPFNRWFTETVLVGCHGMSADQLPPPNELFLDWSA